MNLRDLLLLVLGMFCMNVSGADARPQAKLLLLGDSITLGIQGDAYVQKLTTLLNDGCQKKFAWTVIVAGIGGETIIGAKARVKALLEQHKPDYMTVSYGLNDLYVTKAKTDPKVFEDNLLSLLKDIRSERPAPQIFLLTCTPVDDTRHFLKDDPIYKPLGGANGFLCANINPITRRVAQQEALPLFDLHPVILAGGLDKMIVKDGVHMTEAGRQLLVESIGERVAAFVRARVIKLPAAVSAEKSAGSMVAKAREQAKSNTETGKASARQTLSSAAAMCPYLADIFVALDGLNDSK